MNQQPTNGTRQRFNGKPSIYYDGYWIREYPLPEDTLASRKELIDHLTRRAFHHTEPGINTPGSRLDAARAAWENQKDPSKKRVNGAMLAGALFNRATDIFTAIVDLEQQGVRVSRDNELMKACGGCFKEALELGKMVKHYSGQEGIDELWGEPFKAFSQPIAQLFESRYRKIAQTMRDIDRINEVIEEAFSDAPAFAGLAERSRALTRAAKQQIETMKSDSAFFRVWPAFIATRENLESFEPAIREKSTPAYRRHLEVGIKLIYDGAALITYLAEARVPMPKSSKEFRNKCEAFKADDRE